MKLDLVKTAKLLFIILLLFYGITGVKNPAAFWILNGVDLGLHEFGHLFFCFLGEFIQFLGGTLFQLIVPIGITIYFYYKKQLYSSAVTLFWTAQSFFNISVYIKDARAQVLPLVGGGVHDWNYMLGVLNLLPQDQVIGNCVELLGWIVMLGAVGCGIYTTFIPHNSGVEDQSLNM